MHVNGPRGDAGSVRHGPLLHHPIALILLSAFLHIVLAFACHCGVLILVLVRVHSLTHALTVSSHACVCVGVSFASTRAVRVSSVCVFSWSVRTSMRAALGDVHQLEHASLWCCKVASYDF